MLATKYKKIGEISAVKKKLGWELLEEVSNLSKADAVPGWGVISLLMRVVSNSVITNEAEREYLAELKLSLG